MKAQKIRIKNKSGSRKRRAKVIELESIWGMKLLNMVRQFDMAYGRLKDLMGETGGIPEEEAMVLRDNALKAVREFSDFIRNFSEKVDFKYYPPKGLGSKKPKGLRLVRINGESGPV
jgi:hypothetical protein